MCFSVLEQFEITKYSFESLLRLSKNLFVLGEVFSRLGINVIVNIVGKSFERVVIKPFIKLLKKPVIWIYLRTESLFIPNGLSTKNYMYSRIMSFCLKTYFKLLIKRRLILFIRCSSQIVKFKIQYNFQKVIETNFGHGYPYYSRLLNYYPYLFVTFFLIVCHNFNGLFFYGFTNTAFLLQNFVISFQAVIGLTFIAYL